MRARRLDLTRDGLIRFLDVARHGAGSALSRRDLDSEAP